MFAETWGDSFPAAEDWDNEEYTGSLADSKVFTPSALETSVVAPEPVQESSKQDLLSMGTGTSQVYQSGSLTSVSVPLSILLVSLAFLSGATRQVLSSHLIDVCHFS